jgi:hypothetical protein
MRINTGTSVDASKEVSLEANLQKTMFVSRYQNPGQYHDAKIWKCVRVHIFESYSNKSKSDSRVDEGETGPV